MPSTVQIMDALGTYLDGKLIDELVSNGKLASSTLLNSLKHEVRQTLRGVEVVGTMVYYGQFVNNGRKIGAKGVPIQVLMDWIKLKGIESDITRAKSIAFAIQRSIKLNGIKPLPFIENAIKGSIQQIDNIAGNAFDEQIARELDIIFKIGK